MKTLTQLVIALTAAYLGCIAAAQYQPRHDAAQHQDNSASQAGIAMGDGKVTNTNTTQQDNRMIEGQPPSYTFMNAAIDKALLLLLIWQAAGHRSTLTRIANGHNAAAA